MGGILGLCVLPYNLYGIHCVPRLRAWR
jgi:hypothetical protein